MITRKERGHWPRGKPRNPVPEGWDETRRRLDEVADKRLSMILARKLGIDRGTILRWRRQGDIPSPEMAAQLPSKIEETFSENESAKKDNREIIWPEWALDAMGKESDYSLARRLGVSRSSVKDKRLEMGIPPAGKICRRYKWTEENLSLLGKIPDTKLAKKMGVSAPTVGAKRKELNIPPLVPRGRPSNSREWSEAELSLLGKISDAKIAKRLGISVSMVSAKRKKLDIPAAGQRRKWTAEEEAMLGTMPDREVAKRIGVSAPAVLMHRRRLGIPPRGRPKQAWPQEQVATLGKIPDAEIARQMGCSVQLVGNKRRELGIPAHRAKRVNAWGPEEDASLLDGSIAEVARRLGRSEAAVAARRNRLGLSGEFSTRRWTEEKLAILGTIKDSEAAEKLGLSITTVAKKRKSLFIPPASFKRYLSAPRPRPVSPPLGPPNPRKIAIKPAGKPWTDEEIASLGTASDQDVARQLHGRTLAAVRIKRIASKIPAFHPPRRDWTREEIALLGRYSDHKIAVLLGCSWRTVFRKRRAMGIPPFRP